MKKLILLVATSVLLSACDSIEEQKKQQEYDMEIASENLPEGCSIGFAGTVRNVEAQTSHIYYVQCGKVITTNLTTPVGKTVKHEVVISIKDDSQ